MRTIAAFGMAGALAVLLTSSPGFAQPVPLPNPSFEQGTDAPDGWTLSGGAGVWETGGRTGKRCISVTGDGKDSNRWETGPLGLKPLTTYRVSYWAKTSEGAAGGCIVSGPSCTNHDMQAGQDWERRTFIFLTPTDAEGVTLHLGQWTKKGKVWFDDVELREVQPLHARVGGMELSAAERISGGVYTFKPNWAAEWSNYTRPEVGHTAGFNSNRYGFGEDSTITYRFAIGKHQQTGGKASLTIAYYATGDCIVECSRDGKQWTEAGRFREDGGYTAELPDELFPADEVYLRLRGAGSFQITSFSYAANLAGDPPDASGSTAFIEPEKTTPDLPVVVRDLATPFEGPTVELLVRNRQGEPRDVKMRLTVTGGRGSARAEAAATVAPGGEATLRTQARVTGTGQRALSIRVLDAKSDEVLYAATSSFTIPQLYASDFGHGLLLSDDCTVWWAEGTYKISRERPPATDGAADLRGVKKAAAGKLPAVTISAAANEYEPFQLVLHPNKDLSNVTVEASALTGPAKIASDDITIKLVNYVHVETPTDYFGCVGDWPDPLPPYEEPFTVEAGRNQPLWFTVRVPKDAPPGDYEGTIRLAADGAALGDVGLRLHVWDFALSDDTHTDTAYGVGLDSGFMGLKTDEQRRQAWDLWMQDCAAHRISPYRPMSFAPIKWEIKGPRLEISNGPLKLVCDQFDGSLFRISLNGVDLGSERCTVTQFEKEGIGYQGTGVGWVSPNRIREIKLIEQTPRKCVVELVGDKTTSTEANRKFETAWRYTIYAGQPWLRSQLLYIKNTDEVPWRINGYFHLLAPAHPADAEPYNAKAHSAWLSPDGALGALTLNEGDFEFRLQKRPGDDCHGDLYRAVGVTLQPGETWNAPQPEMILFALPEGDQAAVDGGAARISALLGGPESALPVANAAIRYDQQTEVKVTHDFSAFDEDAHRYLDELRFNAFNFGGIPGSLAGHKRFTPEFNAMFARVFGPITEHLREKGWLKKAYCYWYDEPREEDYPYVIEGMKLLKDACPGLTRLLTEQPEPALYDYVDLWVPVLSRYREKDCRARQAAGDRVWWYVCTGPRAPYPNNFIDHPAINHRIRFWMMEKYGVTGSLYWSTTYYRGQGGARRNPWETAMSVNPGGGFWGNGDGMLLYPPVREPSDEPVIKPPVDSMRWEMLREGIEDREYMWTLKQRIAKRPGSRAAKRAQKVLDRSVAKLVTSLTEYDNDPQDLYAARRALAEAIESLK